MNVPVFVIDRTWLPIRADFVGAISSHLDKGEIVQVVDSEWLIDERLDYGSPVRSSFSIG